MSQVLRINDNDPRVTYDHGWIQTANETGTTDTTNGFFVLFRGTSVKLYGSSTGKRSLVLSLDGKTTSVLLTNVNGSQLIFGANNIADGDHQLGGAIASLPVEGMVAVDYFEIENSSGGGFDLIGAGPTASNVPTQAVTVDDTNPEIVFHNTSQWLHGGSLTSYGRTLSTTATVGVSLSYSFDGVAIWYYGSFGPSTGAFTVSVDGSTPERLNGKGDLYLDQRMLWSNASLGPGRHTVTLTNDDAAPDTKFSLDFFRILLEKDASALHSTSSPTATTASTTSFTASGMGTVPVDPTNTTRIVPLAVGLTLGLLAILTVVLGSVWYLHRRERRRRSAHVYLDAHSVSPYTVPATTQADQQEGLSQDRKSPQPTRMSSAPMTIDDPTMSFVVNELGPPPSYESPMYDRKVGAAV